MWLLSCFAKNDTKFEAFRSKEIALFALIEIGRKDCARLLWMVEQIDPSYTKYVSAPAFAQRFCAEYGDTFLFLFRIFFALIVPKAVVIHETVKHDPDEDDVLQPSVTGSVVDDHSVVHGSLDSASVVSRGGAGALLQATILEDKMPYHYLLSFVLLFMSIPSGNLQSWLFWLCYTAREQKPDHNNMEALITSLWPKNPKLKSKIETMKKKAQTLLIIVDPADLDPSKLRMFDANTGGAWSKPLLMLQKRIRQHSLGYFFWRRLSGHIDRVGATIDDAYVRLKEPYKLTKWGKKNAALVGDRKLARKDVRVIVRLHMSYLQLLSEYDGSEITGSSRRGSSARSTTSAGESDEGEQSVLYSIYAAISAPFKALRKSMKRLTTLSTSSKIYPTGFSAKGSFRGGSSNKFSAKYSAKYGDPKSRKFSTMDWMRAGVTLIRQAAARPPPIVVDKDEFISLEEKYKESLHIPVDIVYKRVSDAQSRAQRMIELCDEEIQNTTFEPVAFAGGSTRSEINAGPSVRASRQVVDVSDSEDDEPGAINMSAPMPNIATGGSLEGSSLDSPGEGYDGPDGDGGEGGEGDGMYEYSDSEEGDMNARPTVAPKPQVLKSIMKKR